MTIKLYTCRGCGAQFRKNEDHACPGCGRVLPGPRPGATRRKNNDDRSQVMYLRVPNDRYKWLERASEKSGLSMAEIQRGALAALIRDAMDVHGDDEEDAVEVVRDLLVDKLGDGDDLKQAVRAS